MFSIKSGPERATIIVGIKVSTDGFSFNIRLVLL